MTPSRTPKRRKEAERFSETEEGKNIIREFHDGFHSCDSERGCLWELGRLANQIFSSGQQRKAEEADLLLKLIAPEVRKTNGWKIFMTGKCSVNSSGYGFCAFLSFLFSYSLSGAGGG